MKKVIEEHQEPNVVELDDIDVGGKIYASVAYGEAYKLHRIDDVWMFCGLSDSVCGSCGRFGTAENAIRTQLQYGVCEFDNVEEFLQWALQEIK